MKLNTKLTIDDQKKYRNVLAKMHFDLNVGHVGGNFSSIDAMLIIFNEYLSKNDKFVLSKGHSSGALYVCLFSIGLLSQTELMTFHSENTTLPGHPRPFLSKFTPFATGSLGHGLSISCGLAKSNILRNVNSNIFCFMSDGEWQEGSTWEAFLFFLKHKLFRLKIIIDVNGLQGFGNTNNISIMSDFNKRLSGFPVKLINCEDGHDLEQLRHSLNACVSSNEPSIILLNTIKGHGFNELEGKLESHYLPLSKTQYKKYYGENS